VRSLRTCRLRGAGSVTLTGDVGGTPGRPAVALLHGGGQTRHSWKRAALDLVRAGYHVIAPDLRGHGDSDWASDGDYRLDAFVADLRAVMASLPVPPALVGGSLGGLTALLAAGEGGDPRPSALVLVDVVPRMEAAGRERVLAFMAGHPEGFATLDEAADAVAAYAPHRSRSRTPAGLARNLRRRADGRLYWHWDPAYLPFARGHDDPARLCAAAARVRVPTLLVYGQYSDVVSARGIDELRALIPSAETVEVGNAAHMLTGDPNDVFNAAVRGFLARARADLRDSRPRRPRPGPSRNRVSVARTAAQAASDQDGRPAAPDRGPRLGAEPRARGGGEGRLEARGPDVAHGLGDEDLAARGEAAPNFPEEALRVGELVDHREGEHEIDLSARSSIPSDVAVASRASILPASPARPARRRSPSSI
jgi:non-heme chloroperoxidase